jgi:Tol biopolymer transport system component
MIIARDSAIGLIAWRGDILTMWVRDVNGVEVLDVSSQQVLTTIVDYEGSTPVLSPDGTKIAYATEDGVFHVVPVPARSP